MGLGEIGSILWGLFLLATILFPAIDIKVNAKHISRIPRIFWSLSGLLPVFGVIFYAAVGRSSVLEQEKKATQKPGELKDVLVDSKETYTQEQPADPDAFGKILRAFVIIIVIACIGAAVFMTTFMSQWGSK